METMKHSTEPNVVYADTDDVQFRMRLAATLIDRSMYRRWRLHCTYNHDTMNMYVSPHDNPRSWQSCLGRASDAPPSSPARSGRLARVISTRRG